jgi:phthalate 4,5-dioxygenase reductase subunit
VLVADGTQENPLLTTLKTPEVDAAMMALEVVHKAVIAEDVYLFELAFAGGQPLPDFTAGSHVTVVTPNGMTRRYSLCNAPGDLDRYSIAVKLNRQGLGGSKSMVEQVHAGDTLRVSQPQNYFSIDESAQSHLLIAGGIGITPILSMARVLLARQANFRIVYATRSAQQTAFLEIFSNAPFKSRTLLHHDHGDRAQSLDLLALLANPAKQASVYCCGPRPLMQAVREQTRHWPAGSVHFEDFGSSAPAEPVQDGPFVVRLVRSGVTIAVPTGVSILQALRNEGISVPSSCESGTCGSCRTALLAGVAEHRDYVLDEEDHDKEIMICVSRAQSPLLELDL